MQVFPARRSGPQSAGGDPATGAGAVDLTAVGDRAEHRAKARAVSPFAAGISASSSGISPCTAAAAPEYMSGIHRLALRRLACRWLSRIADMFCGMMISATASLLGNWPPVQIHAVEAQARLLADQRTHTFPVRPGPAGHQPAEGQRVIPVRQAGVPVPPPPAVLP
jgi:hypothetical protein